MKELLVRRQRLDRTVNGLGDALERVIGKIEDKLAGLDLRQIEHVVDQRQEVPAVVLHPLEHAHRPFGHLAIDAVDQQLGIAEDRIQRRSQFMAHIGEELRLVLTRLFKLPALVLDFVEQPNVFHGDDRLVGEGHH